MTEGTPWTFEQSRQLNRALTEKVLDKAQNDPQWRQQLIEDPEAAMQTAGFPETQQIQQMQQEASQEGEVAGQSFDDWQHRRCHWFCVWWTQHWDRTRFF